MRAPLVVFVSLFAVSLLSISIAVLDFEPRGISEDEAVLITDILRTELLKTGRITIIEREKINAILKERQLSEVGVTESVELGKLLGVDKIIFGRIGKLGDSYIVTARMIDVESGRVDFADQYTCQITTESITKVMKEIAEVVQKYLPPIEGKVALRKGDVVYITLSSKEGVKEGMELAVYRVEQIKDDEGNVIFEDVREIGRVRVLKVSDKGSAAKILSENIEIEKGDVVKLSLPQLSLENKNQRKPLLEEAKLAPPEREAVSPDEDLLVYYPFDGNANNVAKKSHNCKVKGPILSKDRYGILANAYTFDGISDYMYCGESLRLHNDFTISLWFKTSLCHDGRIMSDSADLNAYEYSGWTIDFWNVKTEEYNGLRFWYAISSYEGEYISLDTKLCDDIWHNIIIVKSSAGIRIYIDGALKGISDFKRDVFYDSENYLLIGGYMNDGELMGLFRGSIDDVRIYSRVLSQEEIEKLYHEH